MVEILETAPDLSPDPLTIKIVDQRNGSGVKWALTMFNDFYLGN